MHTCYQHRVLEVLQQARAVIADEDHWVQGHIARSETGEPCRPTASDAIAWCTEGAVLRVCGSFNTLCRDVLDALQETSIVQKFNDALRRDWDVKICDISVFNDNSDIRHEEIMIMFTQAIDEQTRFLATPAKEAA